MAEKGFTVVGGFYYLLDTTTKIHRVAEAGMKMIFPLRNYIYPLEPWGGPNQGNLGYLGAAGKAGPKSSEMKAIEKAFNEAIDLVNDDPIANDTVILWGSLVDDALSHKEHHGLAREHFHAYCRHMWKHIHDYDRKHRCVIDLPHGDYAYGSRWQIDHGKWQELMGAWSLQTYWLRSESNPVRNLFSSLVTRQAVDRMVRLSAYAGKPPNGKVRSILPCVWVGDKPIMGTKGYGRREQDVWQRTHRISDILIKLVSGAHGIILFQYRFEWDDDRNLDEWDEIIHTLSSNGVFDALLWGERKKDIRKKAVGATDYEYQIISNNNLKDRTRQGSTSSTCRYKEDAITWANIQFKNDRYLILTSSMPNRDNFDWNKKNGDAGREPGTRGLADYQIRTRFTCPRFMVGLKCTDVLTGNEIALSNGVIDVTLGPAESRVYKFEPAEGYRCVR